MKNTPDPSRMVGPTGITSQTQTEIVQPPSEYVFTRKWQVFPGRTKFFCGGRFLLSHQYGIFTLTLFLIVATNVLFFVFDCPFLFQNVSVAIPIVGVLLFAFTFSLLMRTAFMDPGIIPRCLPDEAAYWEARLSYFTTDSTGQHTDSHNNMNRAVARFLDVPMKDHLLKLKWCHTCKMYRPPRCSHCSICDNCVDHFDHHCPWVGNCVGRRNYRYFYSFVVTLSLLAIFIFSCNVAHLVLRSQQSGFVETIKVTPASLIEAIICFLSLWSLLGLVGYHTYLVSLNMTTNEDIKGGYPSSETTPNNFYSHGNLFMNFFMIICGPRTPSFIDATGPVDASLMAMIQEARSVSPRNTSTVNVASRPPLQARDPVLPSVIPDRAVPAQPAQIALDMTTPQAVHSAYPVA